MEFPTLNLKITGYEPMINTHPHGKRSPQLRKHDYEVRVAIEIKTKPNYLKFQRQLDSYVKIHIAFSSKEGESYYNRHIDLNSMNLKLKLSLQSQNRFFMFGKCCFFHKDFTILMKEIVAHIRSYCEELDVAISSSFYKNYHDLY